jgi:hypothetical protein
MFYVAVAIIGLIIGVVQIWVTLFPQEAKEFISGHSPSFPPQQTVRHSPPDPPVNNGNENSAATTASQPETVSPPLGDPPSSGRQPEPQQPGIVLLTPPPRSPDPPGIPKSRIKPPQQELNRSEPAIKAWIVSRSDKVNTVGTRSFPNSTLMSGIIEVGRPVTIIGQFRDKVKIRDEDGYVSYVPKDNVEPRE